MRLLVCTLLALAIAHPAAAASQVKAYVPGDNNPTVEVLALSDPANPYRGQYAAEDEWAFANYARYINRDVVWSYQLSLDQMNENLRAHGFTGELTLARSFVEVDPQTGVGCVVPIRVYSDRLLAQAKPKTVAEFFRPAHAEQPAAEPISFWSFGVMEQSPLDADSAAGLLRTAQQWPRLPQWLTTTATWGDELYLLPDGGAVVRTQPEGSRQMTLRRYDKDGALLKSAEARSNQSWQQLMLTDPVAGNADGYKRYVKPDPIYDKSGRFVGNGSNIASNGRYTAFRDYDGGGLLAVLDYWEGTVLTDEQARQRTIDPGWLFNPQPYETILDVYNAQQGL